MEKRIIVLLLCFMCLLVQGCVSVSTYKMTPEVLAEQKKIDREGIEAVISHKKTASVFIRPMASEYSVEDNPAIVIGVSSENELKISPDDIQAYIDGNAHHILTHDELLTDIKVRHDASVEALKQQYAARSQDLADSSIKDANDPAVFEPNPGRRNAIGNTEQYGYKLDKKGLTEGISDAEEQMDTAIKALNEEAKEKVKNLNTTFILRETTIQPNTWYRGQVKLAKIPDAGKPHDIKLVVSVAGEEHQFTVKTSANK